MPTNLYLCAAAYATANGGPLVAECPAGSGPNIGTNGFLVIPVVALRDSLGNGTFDLLDPARGFKILSVNSQNTNCVLTSAAMPGRDYQVQFVNQLGRHLEQSARRLELRRAAGGDIEFYRRAADGNAAALLPRAIAAVIERGAARSLWF